jgi:hypothetical protein
MMLIQNAYEWSREEAYSFSFRKVTCYRDVTKQQITEILGEDYECFILDLGADFIDSREEFLQCSTKIVKRPVGMGPSEADTVCPCHGKPPCKRRLAVFYSPGK